MCVCVCVGVIQCVVRCGGCVCVCVGVIQCVVCCGGCVCVGAVSYTHLTLPTMAVV